ncbi:AAA family ATPase [Priestia aryabhattai]|uniref:AAA family ATPase n=1 Tax=Priestia aryabhattai TaxID=412384 RepID=UPI001ADAF1C2|nr:AAA family ATPase [Priestia aryabhattai]QTL47336.1 AAA family ATPase [Priestia aryabhattai]
MKIEKLELHNFKQYYGEQKVQFAGYQEKDEKNVTVIYGDNGHGKTSIYRALLLALFGISELAKDKKLGKKGDKFYICNLRALEDSEDGSAFARVKVYFSHEGERFEAERIIISQLFEDGQIEEDFLSAKLIHVDKKGITHIYEKEEDMEHIITKIFDKRMKEYFLFDGEQIEQLMRDDVSQKREVAKGIKNLLKVDALDDSVNVLNKLFSRYHQEVQNSASGDYRNKLKEQEEKGKEISEIENNLEKWNEELILKENEIIYMDEKLKENESIREKVVRRELLAKEIKTLQQEDKIDVIRKMRDFNKRSFNLFLNTEYIRLNNEIQHKWINLENPYTFAKELLEKVIHDQKCLICDSNVEPGTDQHVAVHLLLEKQQEYTYTRELSTLKEEVRSMIDKNEISSERVLEILKEYKRIEKRIKEAQVEIETIKEEIGENTTVDSGLQIARNNLSEAVFKLRNKINTEKDVLNQSIIKKKEIDSAVKELEREERQKDTMVQMKDLADATRTVLKKIQSTFVTEISSEVEKATTTIFRKILDDNSKKNLKEVKIEKDFSLQVTAWNGVDFLPNLSYGQRQILSLSFIISLLSISGGTDKVLEIPLFMDTPISRISGDNRDNLLRLIPEMTPQWILLATDTEFTQAECNELKKTGKWGKVYNLEIPESGMTIAREETVLGFQPKR